VIRGLRKCTENDFTSRGFKGDLAKVTLYFCPDMDIVSSRYILKNGYSSPGERTSFSIEYQKCDSTRRNDCKPNEKI
jgi:hypothetical protein